MKRLLMTAVVLVVLASSADATTYVARKAGSAFSGTNVPNGCTVTRNTTAHTVTATCESGGTVAIYWRFGPKVAPFNRCDAVFTHLDGAAECKVLAGQPRYIQVFLGHFTAIGGGSATIRRVRVWQCSDCVDS